MESSIEWKRSDLKKNTRAKVLHTLHSTFPPDGRRFDLHDNGSESRKLH